MSVTSPIRRAWGRVAASLGNPAGDLAPRYDIVLDEPRDMAGKTFIDVANDNSPAIGAKVRPAPVDSDVLVTWGGGVRRIHVFGEKIIFAGCSPESQVMMESAIDMIEERPVKSGTITTGEAGNPVGGGDAGPPGGL